jgi:hypothetical protein
VAKPSHTDSWDAPAGGQLFGDLWRTVRVVVTGHHQARELERLRHNGTETGCSGAEQVACGQTAPPRTLHGRQTLGCPPSSQQPNIHGHSFGRPVWVKS